jgi:hypothetical protein
MTKDIVKMDGTVETVTEWFLMPSIKECLAEYEKQDIGLIADIAKHGCKGGVAGITYYSETTSFHDHHQEEIWSLLKQHADEAGLQNGNMVCHISTNPSSFTDLINDLVWWAVEVQAQDLVDAPAAGAST